MQKTWADVKTQGHKELVTCVVPTHPGVCQHYGKRGHCHGEVEESLGER